MTCYASLVYWLESDELQEMSAHALPGGEYRNIWWCSRIQGDAVVFDYCKSLQVTRISCNCTIITVILNLFLKFPRPPHSLVSSEKTVLPYLCKHVPCIRAGWDDATVAPSVHVTIGNSRTIFSIFTLHLAWHTALMSTQQYSIHEIQIFKRLQSLLLNKVLVWQE